MSDDRIARAIMASESVIMDKDNYYSEEALKASAKFQRSLSELEKSMNEMDAVMRSGKWYDDGRTITSL